MKIPSWIGTAVSMLAAVAMIGATVCPWMGFKVAGADVDDGSALTFGGALATKTAFEISRLLTYVVVVALVLHVIFVIARIGHQWRPVNGFLEMMSATLALGTGIVIALVVTGNPVPNAQIESVRWVPIWGFFVFMVAGVALVLETVRATMRRPERVD